MTTTTLRKVGGSLMMALPRPLLKQLDLQEGAAVTVSLEKDRLIIQPRRKPSYTLKELLAQCDTKTPATEEDAAWMDAPAVGKEII